VCVLVPVGIDTRSTEKILCAKCHTCTHMRSQDRSINEVGGLYHCGIESRSVAAWNRERDRVGFELGLYSPIPSDMVHKHDAGKFMVNLVVEIARDEPAGIEHGDR